MSKAHEPRPPEYGGAIVITEQLLAHLMGMKRVSVWHDCERRSINIGYATDQQDAKAQFLGAEFPCHKLSEGAVLYKEQFTLERMNENKEKNECECEDEWVRADRELREKLNNLEVLKQNVRDLPCECCQ